MATTTSLVRSTPEWRGAPVQFVGLSATLRNAADFFSALVGLKPGQVAEVFCHPSSISIAVNHFEQLGEKERKFFVEFPLDENDYEPKGYRWPYQHKYRVIGHGM